MQKVIFRQSEKFYLSLRLEQVVRGIIREMSGQRLTGELAKTTWVANLCENGHGYKPPGRGRKSTGPACRHRKNDGEHGIGTALLQWDQAGNLRQLARLTR